MKSFAEIRDLAIARKGEEAWRTAMPDPPDVPLADRPDDRLLSEVSRRVFQAGFNWSVIDAKWPAFETAFHGFDIGRNALMSDDDLDAHLKNATIVRHAGKILAVRDNAVFFSELAREHGAAARYLGTWPVEDTVGLFDLLKKRGTRLGGLTGQYAMRFAGYDAFILSRSVVAALNANGVIEGAASSKTALRKVQDAFNAWHEESGARYAVISRTLALSVPD